MDPALISYLSTFVSEQRNRLFHRVLDQRTRYISVVLEDLYQPHNASAVLRSCDCFGIQEIHIIEGRNPFRVNPEISLGASKWLTTHIYPSRKNNTLKTLTSLKQSGYRIIATVPDPKALPVEEFDLSAGKVALLFGTELNGLSKEALEAADESLRIPMYGFTESLNISVSVAILLYHLTLVLRKSTLDWHLSVQEKRELYGTWLEKSIKAAPQIIKRWQLNHES